MVGRPRPRMAMAIVGRPMARSGCVAERAPCRTTTGRRGRQAPPGAARGAGRRRRSPDGPPPRRRTPLAPALLILGVLLAAVSALVLVLAWLARRDTDPLLR